MKRWIVTLGGSGYLPAPGTWGSLVTTLLLYVLFLNTDNPAAQNAIAAAALIFFSTLNIALAPWAIIHFRKLDPGPFVLDEAAGIALTLLFLPGSAGRPLIYRMIAAFLAFRFFDILKPGLIKKLEFIPGGWGILLDDLAAAVAANVVCQIFLRWVLHLS